MMNLLFLSDPRENNETRVLSRLPPTATDVDRLAEALATLSS